MAITYASPNTGDSLKKANGGGLTPQQLWKKGVEIFEQTHDFFQQFEGKSRRSMIVTETDTSKGRGHKITFKNMSGFYGRGKSGEEIFESSDDYEKLNTGEYELAVDFLRNSSRWTVRTEEEMGMRGEIVNRIPEQLGEWMGREKTDRLFMMFNKKGGAGNYVYANGKGNADALTSDDVLDWDEIIVLKTQMERMGGKAALMGKQKNGQPLFRNNVIATSDALFSLELDPNFKQVMREATTRGAQNVLIEGGYTDVRGQAIRQYVPIDHDGAGPVGSPINPKALVGEAIAPGTTAVTIKGGGNATYAAITNVDYFKHFPKFAYKWLPSDIYDISGDSDFYVLAVNPPGGAEGNKIAMFRVTTNNGNTLVTNQRLAAAASGQAVTTCGSVVWNTGVWEGLHTETVNVGATLVLCNAKGVPLAHTLMLGAGAAVRGYGMWRNHRTAEKHNGDFVCDTYITSVFGQTPRKDVTGRCPAFMHLTHAIQYAGLPIPSNIT